jgi:DNA-binding CsgD family transcriptional regulator
VALTLFELAASTADLWKRAWASSLLPLGLKDTLRVLVCDGPALLGNVGFFWPEGKSATSRHKRLLQALTPLLRERMIVERVMGDAPLWFAALEETLAQLGSPAFIVGPGGAVLHANASGRELLDRERGALTREIAEAVRGAPTRFRSSCLRARGCLPHYLLVAPQEDPYKVKVALAAKHWGLTPRQAQVLALLAEGKGNKTIAATLGCAESTVELHVTAILERAQVATRAEVIVAVWRAR